MKTIKKLVLISLALSIFSNSVMADVIGKKNEDRILNVILTLNTGGLSTTLVGVGGDVGLTVGMYAIMSAGALGVTVLANRASSTTENDANLKKINELIQIEVVNYNASGELGLILQSVVNAAKINNPTLSENEIIDTILDSI